MTLDSFVQAEVSEILNDDGSYKPPSEWPATWQRMCTSYKRKPIYERSTDGKDKSWDFIGYEHEAKFERGNKALELLGKHTSVGAYR